MTSQLCHNFQAIQAVHGADDVTSPHFKSLVNSLSVCVPQVDGLIAVPRFVVIALTLLSVRVTNVVSVLLFELLVVNVIFPCELSLPESK